MPRRAAQAESCTGALLSHSGTWCVVADRFEGTASAHSLIAPLEPRAILARVVQGASHAPSVAALERRCKDGQRRPHLLAVRLERTHLQEPTAVLALAEMAGTVRLM